MSHWVPHLIWTTIIRSMLNHIQKSPILPTRVVVLGSAGFLASAICCRLETCGIPVMALPRTRLDLTHPASSNYLAELLLPDDSLLFVAAKAPVKTEAMLVENLQMGATVCKALREAPVKHVLYISSDAVYADSMQPLTEKSCAQPSSLHGAMHLTREIMLANCYGGPLCILRPTLIYGENDPHNGYGPNRFCRSAASGENIVLFGNGEERRDHVWVEDVAEIALRSLQHQSAGILNVATGEVWSFREVAELVAKLAFGPIAIQGNIRVGPMPHNGFRMFDAGATYMAMPGFRYTSLLSSLPELLRGIRR